jgi:hypothetical protein
MDKEGWKKSDREAAYVKAYEASKRGERKVPSRWEFNVTRKFAEKLKEGVK